jgi:hypothetical protein
MLLIFSYSELVPHLFTSICGYDGASISSARERWPRPTISDLGDVAKYHPLAQCDYSSFSAHSYTVS